MLVVDDSLVQRRILALSLQKWGFEVSEAASGEEALAICKRMSPDIVLSDWMMPGMDGLEFCRQFRQLPRQTYGYFILLTSKTEKDSVARGLDCGADDFLPKPVNTTELRARIAAGERILSMERELVEKNRLLENTLKKIQSLYDAIDSDLVEARKLQQSLVRERFHDFGSARVSLLLHPSGHVGGDLVGFFSASISRVVLYALDVSGHGISSALMTARLAAYLTGSTPEHNVALERSGTTISPVPPFLVADHLNSLVLSEMDTEHYFTMLLADIDLTNGAVSICQAGHPNPMVLRADGTIEKVGKGGFPIGLVSNAVFDQFSLKLAPGDRLMLLSDGVTECPDPLGVHFEDTGLEPMLKKLRHHSGTDLLESMVQGLIGHADSTDFPDDVSAVLFDYRPP